MKSESVLKVLLRKISSRLLNKFLLLFACVIIVSIGVQAFVSYRMLHRQSLTSEITSNSKLLEFVGKELDSYNNETMRLLSSRLNYDQIMKAVREEANDYQERVIVEDYLRSIFYSRNDIEAAYLYILDTDRYFHISRQLKETMVRIDEGNEAMRAELLQMVSADTNNWTVESLSEENSTVYSLDTSSLSMAFHAAFFKIPTRKPNFILTVALDDSMNRRIIDDASAEPGQQLIVQDSRGEIYHRYTDSLPTVGLDPKSRVIEDTEYELVKLNGETFYKITSISPLGTWQISKLIPEDQIAAAASANRSFSILTGIISLLSALVVVFILAKAITRPLNRLSEQMDRFSIGDFSASVEVEGHDELAQISQQFNQMANRTEELIRKTWQLDLAHKEALLKSLVSELNPHFLYNSLQAISTEAIKADNIRIYEMINALSTSFRYCISGDDIVSLEQELDHVRQYLLLQKARFGEDKLILDIDIDPRAMHIEIPKLAVQLLVENSIKHALEITGTRIIISLKAEIEDDYLHIRVSDNGPGIEDDILVHLQKVLSSPLDNDDMYEIGLKNLATRLRLIFGSKASLEANSTRKGTTIHIAIPL